jgi:hypothetical protein
MFCVVDKQINKARHGHWTISTSDRRVLEFLPVAFSLYQSTMIVVELQVLVVLLLVFKHDPVMRYEMLWIDLTGTALGFDFDTFLPIITCITKKYYVCQLKNLVYRIYDPGAVSWLKG